MSADNGIEKKNETSEALGAGGAPQVSEMIDKILANPELITMVASALGVNKKGAQTEEAEERGEGSEAVSANAQESGGGAAAPDIMSAIAPVLASMQKNQGAVKLNPSNDRRTCLLVALKPYLCRERCEAIDYMVKLGRLSEVFRTLS